MPGPIALLAAAVLAVPAPAAAAPADVRLLHGWRDGEAHVAAVEIILPDGWHTYWRAPGAGGIPPLFDWSGSQNLAGVRVEWPHPEVFESFGMRTIGYHDGVVLPLLLAPAEADAPIELDLTLSFGVCKDICIPAQAHLTGRLAATGDAPGPEAAAIEAALARRAHGAAEAGVIAATCRLAPNGRGHDLAATVRLSAAPGREQVAVIEAASRPDIWIGEAAADTRGATVTARAPVEAAGALALDRSALRLTLIDAVRAVDIRGCRVPD